MAIDLRKMTFKLECGHTALPQRVSHHTVRDESSVVVKCCGKYHAGIISHETVLAARASGQPIDLRSNLAERTKQDQIDFINRQIEYLTRRIFVEGTEPRLGRIPTLVPPERVTAFDVLPDRLRGFPGVTYVYDAFEVSQRELVRMHLSAAQRAAASEEWSRQLRVKVAASARKEQHRVLCDIQEID